MDRRTDLAAFVAQLQSGAYEERDALLRLSQLAADEEIESLLAALPLSWQQRFTAWIVESSSNPALLEGVDALPVVLQRFRAWTPSAPATAPKQPHLTDEDRAVLEQMRANRAKHMQRYAEQGPPKPLPPDSPIFKKWSSEEFPGEVADTNDPNFRLQQLASGDAQTRAVSLNALAAYPRADARLLEACERLLVDRSITLISLPYTYGEVRWLAAEAVAALRGVLGRTDPVVIEDVFAPVSASKVEQLARQAGIAASPKAGVEGAIETLERIAAAGKLPRRRIRREPVAPQP